MNQLINQLPAHLQNRQSRAIGQTLRTNLAKSSPPHLSIEGGRFTLIDSAGNELPVPTYDPQLGSYIDVNIIDANDHVSKIYWGPDNQYNPNAQTYLPPVCYSDNGIGPSRGSAEPQAPTCLQCPHGVWGSATSRITGKAIKACQDLQKLAFTYAGFQIVFQLRVPPNSLKNLGSYQASLGGVDISDLVTRISFVPGIQGTLQFQSVNYIDEATAQIREQALSTNATDALIGRHDAVHPGATALGGPDAQQQIGYTPPPQNGAAPAPAFAPQPNPPAPAGQAATIPQAQPPFGAPQQRGFVPAAPPSQQPGQTASAPPAGGANATTPAAPRRGRPRNQAPAQQQPAQQVQAPFPTGATPFPPTSQSAPANNFGIVQGVPPNPELSAALASVFKN